MGHPMKRGKFKRPSNFLFKTRTDVGIVPDTAHERAEKERLVAEFLKTKKKGATDGTAD